MLRICSLLVLLATPLHGQSLSGPAEVVDGDGLRVAGETVRLYGIDAPEMGQGCLKDGARWACGRWARDVLDGMVAGAKVACEGRGRDRYGRLLATCRAGGRDLGEAMVGAGAAFAYRTYALDYVDAEKAAAIAGRGLWAGDAERPSDWRAAQIPAPAAPAQDGCAIKGNISKSGRIYHLPGQEHYARTRIDPDAGERWFCSEAEARAAGWRRARR